MTCTNSVYNEMHFITEYTFKTRPKPALSWAHAPYMVNYDVTLSNCHDSSGTDGENCHEISYFLSLTAFKSCESRDNEIVTDLLMTPKHAT